MRISDWSSDVCSSDLKRQEEQDRLRIEQTDRQRAAKRIAGRYDRHDRRGRRITTPALPRAAQHAGAQPGQICRASPLQCKEQLRIGRSEEHTSELQSLMRISYAVFCLKKKNTPR